MRDFTAKLLTLCRIISGVDGEKCSIAGETETPTDLLIEQLQYHQLIPLVYYYRQQLQAAGWDFDQSTIELLRSHTFSNISRRQTRLNIGFLKELSRQSRFIKRITCAVLAIWIF